MKPVIGITKPQRGDSLAYLAVSFAVRIAGGRPLKLSTGMSWQTARIDGLLIGGGEDIFPPHYGQEAIENARYDEGRDEMEMYWARKARDQNIPTLAICRGAQLMNVAHGGSLHQNLSEIYENTNYPVTLLGQATFRKSISIVEGSLLSQIVGTPSVKVNSIHSQAIAELGDDLIVTSREKNGIVQSIEDQNRSFYLGVQFHPELMVHRSVFRRIFMRLVQVAKREH